MSESTLFFVIVQSTFWGWAFGFMMINTIFQPEENGKTLAFAMLNYIILKFIASVGNNDVMF